MLEKLLKSNAEAKILSVCLFHDALHLRGITRRAGISPSEAKRELDNLVALGLLKSAKRGNQVIFTLNQECPFLPELRGLYLKTDGIGAQLRKKLEKVAGIKYAFIFGSMAKGDFRERSDVDVLVIGEADDDELAGAVFEVQKKVEREINYITWSEKTFLKKVEEGSVFLKNLRSGQKIWLAGDENGFEGAFAKWPRRRGRAR